VGVPGRLINWRPFKPIHFKLFWPRTGLAKFMWMRAQTANNFRRNSFACGNLSVPASYIRLFQWYLGARYTLGPWEAARLASHIFPPGVQQDWTEHKRLHPQEMYIERMYGKGQITCLKNINNLNYVQISISVLNRTKLYRIFLTVKYYLKVSLIEY
jgi:hypothetical protein